jgi:3-hexulose-6-phosphate synthase
VNIQPRPHLAIAGGITKSDIPNLKPYPLDIIIIGGAITRAENPKKKAEEIRKLVDLTFLQIL